MAWCEKRRRSLEAIGFVKSQVYPCLLYREYVVLLFHVDDCLMFSPSEDIIYDVYASLQVDLNIEDNGDLNKYIGIDPDRLPYGSIHIIHNYLTERTINMILGMDK